MIKKYIGLANKQGKPHCWLQDQEADGYINITLPACIVGYDFGTTVGMISARFLLPDFQEKSQLITNSEMCFPFEYTVYSKCDYCYVLIMFTVYFQHGVYRLHSI